MNKEYDYELDEAELAPPKPYTLERRAEIGEMMSQIAADFAEINGR